MTDMKNDPDRREQLLSTRLSLAEAWIGLWQVAYDALLHHGINFRSIKEFANDVQLDEARKGNISMARYQELVMEYIERVRNGIQAAIRRKTMKLIT